MHTGNVLLVALNIGLFALYETETWTFKRHRTDGPLQAACFSPNSRYLLAAVNTQGSVLA
jgi:uncharacterized protein with WD repeat